MARESSPERMKMLKLSGWRYMHRAYYGPGGRKGGKGRVGEREHDLAIETVHRSEQSKNMEVEVSEGREDIGKVVWFEL